MKKKIFKIKYVTNIGLGYWIDRFDGEFGTIGHYNVLLLPFCIIRWGTVTKIEPKPIWKQIIETCGGEEPFMGSAGLKPKQKTTFEEAAYEDCKKSGFNKTSYAAHCIQSFINGANWRAERMYNEEDMIEFSSWILLQDITSRGEGNYINTDGKIVTVKDLFEQFKKK